MCRDVRRLCQHCFRFFAVFKLVCDVTVAVGQFLIFVLSFPAFFQSDNAACVGVIDPCAF